MSETITFETGLKTFDVNGKCEVTFNPYSAAFIQRMEEAAKRAMEIHENLDESMKKRENERPYELYRNADNEIRDIIDSLFYDGFCDACAPKEDVFMVDIADGLPVWTNLIYAMMDMMDDRLSAEKDLSKNRIRKYSEKYGNKK